MSINSITLTGRTTADIEVKTSAKGTHYCNFQLAVPDGFGDKKETDFFSLTAFGKTADNLAQFVKKGSMIGIIGKLKTNSYVDNDGKKRVATYVRVNEVSFESLKRDDSMQETLPSDDFGIDTSDLPY